MKIYCTMCPPKSAVCYSTNSTSLRPFTDLPKNDFCQFIFILTDLKRSVRSRNGRHTCIFFCRFIYSKKTQRHNIGQKHFHKSGSVHRNAYKMSFSRPLPTCTVALAQKPLRLREHVSSAGTRA